MMENCVEEAMMHSQGIQHLISKYLYKTLLANLVTYIAISQLSKQINFLFPVLHSSKLACRQVILHYYFTGILYNCVSV